MAGVTPGPWWARGACVWKEHLKTATEGWVRKDRGTAVHGQVCARCCLSFSRLPSFREAEPQDRDVAGVGFELRCT